MTMRLALRQQLTLIVWLYLIVAALLTGLELVVVVLLVPALIWAAMFVLVALGELRGWWA